MRSYITKKLNFKNKRHIRKTTELEEQAHIIIFEQYLLFIKNFLIKDFNDEK